VIKGKGIHAVDLLDGMLAPRGQRPQQDLRVARAPKHHAGTLQLRPQRAKVVDLTVEDQAVARLLVEHRLVPGRREIEDRQPPEAEARNRPGVAVAKRQFLVALVIRPAMNHRLHHGPHGRLHLPTITADDPADSTHRTALPSRNTGVNRSSQPP
jgi:hypothetical protein